MPPTYSLSALEACTVCRRGFEPPVRAWLHLEEIFPEFPAAASSSSPSQNVSSPSHSFDTHFRRMSFSPPSPSIALCPFIAKCGGFMRGINVTLPISLAVVVVVLIRRIGGGGGRRNMKCTATAIVVMRTDALRPSLSPSLPPSNQIVPNVIIGFAAFSYIGLARSPLPPTAYFAAVSVSSTVSEGLSLLLRTSLSFLDFGHEGNREDRRRGNPLMRQIGRR